MSDRLTSRIATFRRETEGARSLAQRVRAFAAKLRQPIPTRRLGLTFAALPLLPSALFRLWFYFSSYGFRDIFEGFPILSLYPTLWQIQIALAGAALPFLLLLIEFAKDELYATERSARILLNRTFIY